MRELALLVLVACSRATPPAPPDSALRSGVPSSPVPPTDAPPPDAAPPASAAPANVRTTPHRFAAKTCKAPLAAHAATTYDDARAQAIRDVPDGGYRPELCSGLGVGDVAVGVYCGLRFVEQSDCLWGETAFFDGAGKLVAVYSWGDVLRPCGAATIYGDLPTCTPRPP